jgi:hypothetical protein
MRKIGARISLPELVDAGYLLIGECRCSGESPKALIAAHENGEHIDHERVIGLAEAMHASYKGFIKGEVKFLRLMSSLKQGINLKADVPALLERIGFSFGKYDSLDLNVTEMAEHLIKLGLFKPSEFEGLIVRASEKSSDAHMYENSVCGALKVLDSVEGYQFTQDLADAVYKGFSASLPGNTKWEGTTNFFVTADLFRKHGIPPDAETMGVVASKIFSSNTIGDFKLNMLDKLKEYGYNIVPGLVEYAFAKLSNPKDETHWAFIALDKISELGGQIDAQRIVDIGVRHIEEGTWNSYKLGKRILDKAQELYGAKPEPAIAKLLDYSSPKK